MRPAFAGAFLLLLAACSYPAQVQRSYNYDRDQCRADAESKEAQFVQPKHQLTPKERNAVLATLFSRCMSASGWTVATPPRQTANNIPPVSGSPSTDPIASALRKPGPAEPAPTSGTPSTQPSAAARQRTNQAPDLQLQPSPIPLAPSEEPTPRQRPTARSTQYPASGVNPSPAKGVAITRPTRRTPAAEGKVTDEDRKSLLESLQQSR